MPTIGRGKMVFSLVVGTILRIGQIWILSPIIFMMEKKIKSIDQIYEK